MTDPDPNETPVITVPSTSETTHVRPGPAEPPAPIEGNGSTATTLPPLRPEPPEPAGPRREERVVPPPPPTSTVLPRTSPPAMLNPPPSPSGSGGPPAPERSSPAARLGASVGSRWMVIHPHVSFFSWLADKQGPVEASPQERLARYRQSSPWLFRTCVLLDLLVLFVVTGILVVALAAVLFKAIFGVL